jgi:hypothetical protein
MRREFCPKGRHATYAPLAVNAEVVVYTAENQIKKPYDVVGIISYKNVK